MLEDMSWRCFKTSWRQAKCLLRISVSNKSKSVSNKSISYKAISEKFKANPKYIIYNPMISKLVLFWISRSISISLTSVRFCEICWIYLNSTLRNSRGSKNKVLSNILHKYVYMNNRSFTHLYLYWKNLFRIKKSTAFANLLMEKPDNWFSIANCEQVVDKLTTSFLRKGNINCKWNILYN